MTTSATKQIHTLSLFWVATLVLFSAAPEVRAGEVQVLELFQLARIAIVIGLLAWAGLRFPRGTRWDGFVLGYSLFFGAAIVLAVVALRLPTFPQSESSILKKPFAISLARLMELFLGAYFMLSLVRTFRSAPGLLHRAMDFYVSVATLSAICSISAYGIFLATGWPAYFVYGSDDRVRGFFNEGGPYGLFLVSAILVALLRFRLSGRRRFLLRAAAVGLLFSALLLSASKAGLLVAMLCGLYSALALTWRQRLLAVLIAILVGLTFWFAFQNKLLAYKRDITDFDAVVLLRSDDINLVMGRVVATLIVPRMIEAHPVLGIGIGNYSLMRNDPDYLQGLPSVDDWDLPGLGLVSAAAELGIPLAVFFAGLLLRPAWLALRSKAPAIALAVAVFQPCAVLLGVNLNFFYPWLVTAFALAQLEICSQRPRHTPT